MKRILMATLAMLLVATTAFASGKKDNDETTKWFKVGDIHGVRANSAYYITYEEGNSDLIEVTCPKETMEYLSIKNSNGILTLGINWEKAKRDRKHVSVKVKNNNNITISNGNCQLQGPIKVKAKSRQLDVIILGGASTLKTKGTFKGGKATIKLSGASHVEKTSLSVEDVYADLSGATSISINGSFKSVNAGLSGASSLTINGNMVGFDIDCSGASSVKASTHANKGKLELSGASKATIDGSIQDLEIECSGASSAALGNLTAKNIEVEVSGASNAKLNVLSSIKGTVSGASSLTYSGSPATEALEKSRTSSIRKLD